MKTDHLVELRVQAAHMSLRDFRLVLIRQQCQSDVGVGAAQQVLGWQIYGFQNVHVQSTCFFVEGQRKIHFAKVIAVAQNGSVIDYRLKKEAFLENAIRDTV